MMMPQPIESANNYIDDLYPIKSMYGIFTYNSIISTIYETYVNIPVP